MVHAIKMGWIKPKEPKDKSVERHKFYLMWDADDKSEDVRRLEDPIPAPKPRLPGHEESYNPPPEYAFNEKEIEEWNKQKDAPYKRKYPFVPQRYSSLRSVPAYSRFARERFVRCLDLYLCPRTKKMRLTIQPEDLVPQLPKPKDLQPFPTICSMIFKGHTGLVRCVTHDPSGQFIASGSDDQTVKGKVVRRINKTSLLICFMHRSMGNRYWSLFQDLRSSRHCPLSRLVPEFSSCSPGCCCRPARLPSQSRSRRSSRSSKNRRHSQGSTRSSG